jgi:hypothetical protein
MALSQAVGPILRIVGLAIELVGVTILLLSGRNGGADVGARFGLAPNAVWAIVIVGFALWAVGTVWIYVNRAFPARKDRDDL